MNPTTILPIAFVGTVHDYRDLSNVTLMYRDIVPKFMRRFEKDLSRTDTLLILEGNAATITGKGDAFFGYKSRNYRRKLKAVFGDNIPHWFKPMITTADNRDFGFQFHIHFLVERIVESGAITITKEMPRPTKFTKGQFYELVAVQNQPLPETSEYGTIDWKAIAEKVFLGSRKYVEKERTDICTKLQEGCDRAIVETINRWKNFGFRKIVVLAGALHSKKLSTDLSLPYYEIMPEVIEANLFSLFPSDEYRTAYGMILHNGFYDNVAKYCIQK